MKVGIVGAGGYAGGELLGLLLTNREVKEIVAGSESMAGKPVHAAHPNLRKRTDMQFAHYEDVTGCDVIFLSLPNGTHRADEFDGRAKLIIDLSSDHRLRDPKDYETWYGMAHPYPEDLARWVYGIPELHRARIKGSTRVTGAGCNATATILALLPLFAADVVDRSRPVVVECKVGSSEGGREPSEDSHHPQRVGVVRSHRPVGHCPTAAAGAARPLGSLQGCHCARSSRPAAPRASRATRSRISSRRSPNRTRSSWCTARRPRPIASRPRSAFRRSRSPRPQAT